MNLLAFAWRNLRREFRHGELGTLAVALVLGVAACGAVATLGDRVERAILASAAELIGGDLGVSGRAPLPAALQDEAEQKGLAASASADFNTVLFANGKSQLCDIHATDSAYPLRGELHIRDGNGREQIAHAPDPGSVYVESAAMVTLGLHVGDTLTIGNRNLQIIAQLISQPDGGQWFALAPRVLMSLVDAQASGLLATGSRARYRLLLAGDETKIAAYREWVRTRLPESAELITVQQSQDTMRTAIERGESFLRLAALLAALLSGIAITLAAQRYAHRKIDEIALLRCLGASRRELFAIPALTLILLGVPACALGAALGLGLQHVAFVFAQDLLPGATPATPLAPTATAFVIGLSVLIGFAMPPLLRLRDVPPVRVFQRAVATRVRGWDAFYLLPVVTAALLIYSQTETLQLSLVLCASLLGVIAATLSMSAVVFSFLGRSGKHWPSALRFGLASLTRRRRLSLVQSTALALCLTALNLLTVIGPSLLAAWRSELPPDTPNYFLINVQPDQSAAVASRLQALQVDNLNTLPLAVGKLISINSRAPNPNDYSDKRTTGWINGETRVSWSDTLPPANRLLAGHWFAEKTSEPEASVDQMWIDMFHLKLGDTLGLRIGEREINARITSIRGVRWDSFRVNFFVLLDPDTARTLPYSSVASFHLPAARATELGGLTHEYPNLSLIDIGALLDRVRDIVSRISQVISWVLAFSLLAALLVLIAALSASADERRLEAALLRTLGASRRQLSMSVLAEFAVLGGISGLVAAIGAGAAGFWLAKAIFRIDFLPPIGALAAVTCASAAVIALAGWLGTRRITRTSPLLVLRRA